MISRWRAARALAAAGRVPALRWPLLSFLLFRAVETGAWITLLVWAHDIGGAAASGLMAAGLLLPGVVVTSVGSVIIGRGDPLRMLRWVYLAQTLAALATGAAVVLAAPTGLVLLAGMTLMASFTLTRPIHHAMLPLLARSPEELTVGNAGSSTAQALGELLGPMSVAALLVAVDLGWVFLALAGLATLAAFGARGAVVVHVTGPAPTGSLLAEAHDGIRAVRRDPAAGLLTAMFAGQYVVFGLLRVLIVVLAIDLLRTGGSGAALLSAALGVGAFIGSMLTLLLLGRVRLAPGLLVGVLLTGLPIAMIGLTERPVAALLLLAVVGVGQALFDVAARTLLHRSVPPRVLVRLFGLQEAVLVAGAVTGALLVPGLVLMLGSRGAFLAAGVLLPAIGLVLWTRIRGLDRATVLPGPALEILSSLSMFAVLPQPELEQLARALVSEPAVAAGETVVTQGAPGDRFFIIVSGTAVVRRDDQQYAELGAGDGFGEIALLRDVPRTASVVATTPLELVSLAREPFLLAVTGSTVSLRTIDDRVDGMLGQREHRGR